MVKINISDNLLDFKDFSRLLPKELENVGNLESNFTDSFTSRSTYGLVKNLSIFKSPSPSFYSFSENKITGFFPEAIALIKTSEEPLTINFRSNALNSDSSQDRSRQDNSKDTKDQSNLSRSFRKSSRISGDLWDLVNQSVTNGAIASSSILTLDKTQTNTLVRITTGNVDTLLPALKNLGFKLTAAVANLNFIEGYIPISVIPQLEALAPQGLLGVLSVYAPITSVGLVTSQADFLSETDRVRASLPTGFDGTGIRIGVLSDSYNSLGGAVAGIGSGDLPAGVQVLQDSAGSDEGRAMLELIHDLAPGSALAFATANGGEANLAQNIRNLANPALGNTQIIVDDVVYFAEPFFQDGVVAQAVDDVVTNRGVSYFSAAGNLANQAYESTNINFIADAGLNSILGPNTYYDFNLGAGTDDRQRITLNAGQTFLISFQWDDPFYTLNGVDTDLDIFLLDSTSNAIVGRSDANSIANRSPVEVFGFTNNSGASRNYDVVIANFAGPNPGRLKYVNFGANSTGAVSSEYALNASTVVPHSVAVNGKSVAAVNYFAQDIPADFTSLGGSTILFNPDGTLKATPEIREGADFAEIQGTDNTFFGDDIEGNGRPNFFGTSAAAPHAAAIAALIKQANPSFTPAQIYARLESTARDIGAAGFDNLTGAGLINAYDAIFSPVVPVTPNFADGFESGGLGRGYETNTFSSGRVQVVGTAPATGAKNLILSSSVDPGFAVSSRSEAVLRVNTTGLSNIQLRFDEKEFSNVDNAMPAIFSGSSNSDGVALSVDGTNWFRLISLTGTASTAAYQTNSFNLSTFAVANSLTLGADVRIKFQQFDVNTNSGGLFFDNINVQGTISATGGNDTIAGTFGNDVIDGLSGRDSLTGAGGNDVLTGGIGADTLTGGIGGDNFVYNTNRDGIDRITDFTVAQGDRLDFRGLATSLGQTGQNLISQGYLSFVNSGSNAIVRLDQDGAGSIFVPRSYITVNGITASTLNQTGNFIF
jgi:hypothetical protein